MNKYLLLVIISLTGCASFNFIDCVKSCKLDGKHMKNYSNYEFDIASKSFLQEVKCDCE